MQSPKTVRRQMSDANSEPNGRALAGVAGSGGSVAETGSDGLGKLMSRAEEEARLRGRGIVHPHDLALALTVSPDVAELLLRCGVLQQDWRDYINFRRRTPLRPVKYGGSTGKRFPPCATAQAPPVTPRGGDLLGRTGPP